MAEDKDSTTYSTMTDINVKYLKDEDGNVISPVVSGESVFLPNDDKMLQEKIDSMDNLLVYASSSNVGLMSAADKTKLDGITESADSVSVAQNLTSGTKVGTITVNGTGTDLYAPAASGLSIKIQTIQGSVTWPNYETAKAQIGTITVPDGYTYIGIVDKTANKTEYQGSYVYASNQVWARAGSAGAGGTVTVTVNAIFIKGLS